VETPSRYIPCVPNAVHCSTAVCPTAVSSSADGASSPELTENFPLFGGALVVNRIDDEAAAEVRTYGTQLRSKEEVNPGRRLTHSRRIQGRAAKTRRQETS
jgi:hypothetical protein